MKKKADKKWASSALELARFLGVSRKTVHAWILDETSPGRTGNGQFNLTLWRGWYKSNKPRLMERGSGKEDATLPLSRKQEIDLEIQEIELRRKRREEQKEDQQFLSADQVDDTLCTVLMNFDFHLMNAERELILKTARHFKVTAQETRLIVKPCFDSFRRTWIDGGFSDRVLNELSAWLALPEPIRAKIIEGKLRRKQSK